MISAHARYGSRLVALADDVVLGEAIRSDSFVRLYGRFHPDEAPWAVLAVGIDGSHPRRVEIHSETTDGASHHPDLGHVRVTPCTDDPAMPGLPGVLDELGDALVVRYRPGKRCTVRDTTADGNKFVKVGPGADCRHADGVALWRGATDRDLGFDVARPLGLDRTHGAVHQGVVAGSGIMDVLLGGDGHVCAGRVGIALGALATSAVRPTATAPPSTQLARTRRAARRVIERIPGLDGPVRRLVDELDACHGRLARRTLVPVHGAPHAEQWLDDDGRLGLVDFDRFALGEPELDLATFLAELDAEPVAIEAIEHSLVEGFRSSGAMLDPVRLDLYRRHKRLAKVTRTAWSLRPDADERATQRLARLLGP